MEHHSLQKIRAASLEIQLLLTCGRIQLVEPQKVHLSYLLNSELNWERLLKLANQHKIAPLLYHHLADYADMVPKSVLQQLHLTYHINEERNRFLIDELSRLMAMFEQNGLDVLAYKGPLLAQAAYKTLSLRSCGDLDLLILSRSQIGNLQKVLLADGYQQTKPDRMLTDKELDAYLNSPTDYTFEFFRRQRQVYLEVHWDFFAWPFKLSFEPMDVKTRSDFNNEANAPFLSMEDHLLVLAGHLASHYWKGSIRFSWISDIAELVHQHPELNWVGLVERARFLGHRRTLLLGVVLAQKLLFLELPPVLQQAVDAEPGLDGVTRNMIRHLVRNCNPPLRALEQITFFVGIKERWRDKQLVLPYLARIVFEPTELDYQFIRLPNTLRPLYFLIRPIRLVSEEARYRFMLLGKLLKRMVGF